MIYEVYLNDNLLYYPNEDSYAVLNAKLETALNEAGTFECDIPETNIRYADFNNGAQLRSGIISVLKDGVEIFCGEVRESTKNFDFSYHIYAVGELAYLFDSIQPQAKYQGTVEAMFTSMLAHHNSQVENRKKFTKGNVLVSDNNNYVYHFTNREDTLTDLREKLCDTLNGYLRIRKVNGTKYLDLVPLSSYGRYCQQEIQFGINMLDYSENYTANDIATCVIPLGVRFEEDQRTSAAIEGLDEYLTIKGTSVDSYHTNRNYDYVYIPTAVNRFGWVRVVKHWDDVTVAENLKTKAERWLSDAQYAKMQLELSAVDLSLINSDIESFEVGDTVHCWAEPYGMDTTFPVQKKTIYLNDLSKNTIVLSNTRTAQSYTSQQSNAVNQIREEIPQISPLLQESRDQALAMLLDETQGGFIVYEYHYTGDGVADYIEAINICNARTIDASVSRWRWSYNGLGFMTRANTSAPWSSATAALALTNDGKINASRIMTGTLDANQITVSNLSANSITGGTINGNNVSVKNLNAGEIKSGTLNANNGQFVLDMTSGEVTMKNGHFTGEVTAQSGTFGTSKSGQWELTANGFHSKNGPTAAYGQTVSGTYIGKDGFCCNNATTHTWISDGAITSNGTIGAARFSASENFIMNGSVIISANGAVSAQGLSVNGGITIANGGSWYAGYTGTLSWADYFGTGHALNIQNGIIVSAV